MVFKLQFVDGGWISIYLYIMRWALSYVHLEWFSVLCWKAVTLFEWDGTTEQLQKVYDDEEWSGLYWGAGSITVPSCIPACGWEGEFCITPEPDIMLPSSIGE